MNEEIKELIEHAENGYFTRSELVARLIHSSVYIDPQEYVPHLPEDLVSEMKKSIEWLPKTSSEIWFLGGGSYGTQKTNLEVELACELERVKAFGAVWRMYAYFNLA